MNQSHSVSRLINFKQRHSLAASSLKAAYATIPGVFIFQFTEGYYCQPLFWASLVMSFCFGQHFTDTVPSLAQSADTG
jgi:hypothetical protein